jgi:hypothetical protein
MEMTRYLYFITEGREMCVSKCWYLWCLNERAEKFIRVLAAFILFKRQSHRSFRPKEREKRINLVKTWSVFGGLNKKLSRHSIF